MRNLMYHPRHKVLFKGMYTCIKQLIIDIHEQLQRIIDHPVYCSEPDPLSMH